MPQPSRPRPTRAVKKSSNGGAPVGDILPDEIASIRASVTAREQAPSSRQTTGALVNWSRVRDQLGDPFDVERIPLSRLRLMRRDPMLGFGLSFIKTPHMRAKWFIDAKDNTGPNAQVAANVDWALRRIYSSYVLQFMRILDFGFSGIAKRYEFKIPTGTFIDTSDTGDRTESPLWSEGTIQPVCWKPFVPLAPEVIEPIWTGNGDFNGILYNQQGAPAAIGAVQQGDQAQFKIDVFHSLWATHEKDSNDGNIFGYPRLGYAYRYWWSYWFRWAIADRAFEKKSDPGLIVRHPDEDIDNNDNTTTPAREYALEMGERLRAGSTISLPSDVYMGEIDGKPSAVRKWDMEPLKDLIDFDPFDKSFEYLDIMKLRSLWIPEQAFLEGKGGTSSRNVAKEMGDSFTESQAVLAAQLVESINRWIIPQFLATNFPEFVANGGTANMVMKGFADQDVDARNAVLNLIGQQDFGARELMKFADMQAVLEDAGIPILPFRQQQAREKQIADEQAAAQAPPTAPVPGQQVGVVPSSTGFSYIQPRNVIYLSDRSSSFLERLPSSHHYTDPTIRRAARELWQQWHDMYGEEYADFADFLADQEQIDFADVTDDLRKAARRLVRSWEGRLQRLGKVLDRTTDIYKRVMNQASKVSSKDAGLDASPTDAEIQSWIERHAGEFVSTVEFTTREELTDFLAAKLAEGVTDPKELSQEVRDHFADFPGWKADRLARTEIRDAFNASTLLTAQANGVDQVQALDGTGDPDCAKRNGQVFDVTDAFLEREHPNGTLGWRIMPVTLSYRYTTEELPDGASAIFDYDANEIVFSDGVSDSLRGQYMLSVADLLVKKTPEEVTA